MLTIYNLKPNEKIEIDKVNYDANFYNSDSKQDKIVLISHDQFHLNEAVVEIKKKILHNQNPKLIKDYISHIDDDELYFIKDLYYDLAFPYNVYSNTDSKDIYKNETENNTMNETSLNQKGKLKIITTFLKDVFQKIFKQTFIKENIKIVNSLYFKKALEFIGDLNLDVNNENILYIYPESKIYKTQLDLTFNVFLSNLEPKKQLLRKKIYDYINDKHLNLVTITIEDLLSKIEKMKLGDSIIYKINMLNSKKIQFVLDYLTLIFNNVYLINSVTNNIIKEEFFIIGIEKKTEPLLKSVPEISYLYSSENYSYINQLIYLMKIYKKRLLNIFITIDKYYIDTCKIVNDYEKFNIYFHDLMKQEYYNLHLRRIQYI